MKHLGGIERNTCEASVTRGSSLWHLMIVTWLKTKVVFKDY